MNKMFPNMGNHGVYAISCRNYHQTNVVQTNRRIKIEEEELITSSIPIVPYSYCKKNSWRSYRDRKAVQQSEHSWWHPTSTFHVWTSPEQNQKCDIKIRLNVSIRTSSTLTRPKPISAIDEPETEPEATPQCTSCCNPNPQARSIESK